MEKDCHVYSILTFVAYLSGIQLGVLVPPGVREDMLGVRKIKK